jgi:hypothetical protein
MPLQLTVISLDFDSDEKPRTEVFDKEIINIGTEVSNDIVLNGKDIANFHAQLRVEENGSDPSMFITDLGSDYVTRVENIAIEPQKEIPFEFNKRISIGSYLIKPSRLQGQAPAGGADSGTFKPPKSTPARVKIPGRSGDLLKGGKPKVSIPESQHDLKSEKTVLTENPMKSSSSDSALSALKSLAALSTEKKQEAFPHQKFPEEPIEGESAFAPEPVEESEPTESISGEEIEDNEKTFVGTIDTDSGNEIEEVSFSDEDVEEEEISLDEEKSEISAAPSGISSDAELQVVVALEGNDISDLDFEAAELFSVSGVVKHKGKGLSGVTISAGEVGETTTGVDGKFSFEYIVEETPYEFEAAKNGFVFNFSKRSGTLSSDLEVTVEATKLMSISGRVRHHGEPMSGVNINAGPIGSTTTDSDGTFSFSDIAEDTKYEITASKTKFVFETPTISGVLDREIDDLAFNAIQLLSISGRVMHKGNPMEGVEIDGGPLGKTVTDAQGYYCFTDVPDGTEYSLTARKGKYVFGTRKGTSGQGK